MKKVICTVLVLLQICWLMPAFAVGGTPSMDNFVPSVPYSYGQYSDVREGAWYGADQQGVIKTVVELGIMDGMGGDIFLPEGNIRICEAIKMVAVTHSIYTGDGYVFDKESMPWYQTYVDYAFATGILEGYPYPNYNDIATRYQLAHIFSNVLPEEVLPDINTINAVPDVTSEVNRHTEILSLYRRGILAGDAGTHNFRAYDHCSRAEVAAMIARVAIPEKRMHFDLFPYSYDFSNHPDFSVTNGAGITLPLGHTSIDTLRNFIGTEPILSSGEDTFGGPDDISLVDYGGAELSYLTCDKPEAGVFMHHVSITDGQYKILNGIHCGMTETEFLAATGNTPWRHAASSYLPGIIDWYGYYYDSPECQTMHCGITVTLEDSKISSISVWAG